MRLTLLLLLLLPAPTFADDALARARASWVWATTKVETPPTPAPAPITTTEARIEVTLPADAQLYIDGKLMTGTGSLRTFKTPPLREDGYYTMAMATWDGYGWRWREVRKVIVRPGTVTPVEFGEARGDRLPPMEFRGTFPGPLLRRVDCGPGGG